MGTKNNNNNNKSNIVWIVVVSVLLILAVISGIFIFNNYNNKNEEKNLSYTQLLTSIDEGTVEKIEMTQGSTTAKVKLTNETFSSVALFEPRSPYFSL